MINCENCYHFHMCDKQYRLEEHQNCKHYIDKSLIVELPCKVGDEVWVVFEWDSEPMQGEITMVQQQFDKSWNLWVSRHLAFNATAIGETVFFSREEAEKKLKERERCQT